MSYAVLTEKIKLIPQSYLEEISDFVDYIYLKSKKEQTKDYDVTSKINEICYKTDFDKNILTLGLESVREFTKNDSW